MRAAALALLGAGCASAGGQGLLDTGPSVCPVASAFTTVDTSDGIADQSPDGNARAVVFALNHDVRPDALRLELHAGYGVFGPPAPATIRAGTFTIAGAETRYDSCGVCVSIAANQHPVSGEPTDYYMARSGTLELTEVDGHLAGRLTNAELRHVLIDTADPDGNGPQEPTYQTTEIDDGCATTISEVEFNAPYRPLPGDAGVGDGGG